MQLILAPLPGGLALRHKASPCCGWFLRTDSDSRGLRLISRIVGARVKYATFSHGIVESATSGDVELLGLDTATLCICKSSQPRSSSLLSSLCCARVSASFSHSLGVQSLLLLCASNFFLMVRRCSIGNCKRRLGLESSLKRNIGHLGPNQFTAVF